MSTQRFDARFVAWGVLYFGLIGTAQAQFKPVAFPKDTGVSGFVFPASESTIDNWVKSDDTASMASHAWGITANPNTGDGTVGHGADGRKPSNTYSINEFISFKDAANQTQIVVGMHVTTREIVKWSWQSFWWAPDATAPPLPSSKQIAAARPKQLLTMGAPAHYAAALAYSMRTSKDGTVFGYNPYLEASFSGLAGKYPFGVQTNCMSCHANSAYPGLPNQYVGNENIDIAGPQFKGQVRLDFLYSLQQ